MSREQPEPGGDARRRTAQKRLIGFILVLVAANVAYRVVYASDAQQTAALYVGVPAILAIGLALLPRTRTATGALVRGSTLAVLLAGVVLPEGLLCLLFALPLVLLVAVIVGAAVDLARRRGRGERPTLMAVSVPLFLMSLEGVAGSPFDTGDGATATITVEAPPAAVAAALATPPAFETELPAFLRLGFNRPVGATGSGLDVGDHRTIVFTGGTHDDHPLRLFGLTGERGVDHHSWMHLTVTESRPGRAVFTIDHDMTMLARWADLRRAVVTWEPAGDTTTRVSWRLEYDRLLSPAFYFTPLERYGMGQAAEYLLDAVVAERLP